MSRALAFAALTLSCGTWAGARAAAAQAPCAGAEPSDVEIEEARAFFTAGSAAIEAGRWDDAVRSFEQSYALSCAPSSLYNAAVALRALGRHREARDAFERVIAHAELDVALRESATRFRLEEANRVAVLTLAGLASDARPDVSFDGRAVEDTTARPIRIETDAGTHALVARIPAHQPFVWQGELIDGEREVVRAVFEPLESKSGFPVLAVILVAAAVVLASVAIGVGVHLQSEAQLVPQSDRIISLEAAP